MHPTLLHLIEGHGLALNEAQQEFLALQPDDYLRGLHDGLHNALGADAGAVVPTNGRAQR